MSDRPRRRRRSGFDPAPGRGSGGGEFPLIPAVIIVVLVGLFFGGALAHFLGRASTRGSALPTVEPTSAATAAGPPSPLPAPRPAPRPTATATSHPTPHPTPHPTASSTSSPRPSASPSPLPSPLPSARPSPIPTRKHVNARATKPPSPAPVPKRTIAPEPRTVPRSASTTAPASLGAAERLVERYIDALKRGDTGAAAAMLASGSPTESAFIGSSTRIQSLSQRRNADGSYKVDADLATSKGEYFITFTVSGGIITAKTAIKP
ncbi:MAG: hypothetical protein M1314_00020 [Firmicutes bacterium]|nr:hypothetical protein [Bacillota bacterium]